MNPDLAAFLAERHLASLTLVRPDGRPHVTPVGFTVDAGAGVARIITWEGSAKARLLAAAGEGGLAAAVCQVDGRRWATLEGTAVVTGDPARVAEAVRRYGERYRPPSGRPDRVAIEVAVSRVLTSPGWR